MTICPRNTKEKLNQGKYICPTARARCIKQFPPNHSTKFLHQIQVIDQIIPFFLKYAQIIKSTPALSNQGVVTPIDSVQTPAAENLEGQAVKGTSQIRKSQGSSTVKVNRIQTLIKARYHTFNSVKSKAYLSDGQAVKALN